MKKLIYKIAGYTGVYDPETEETRQQVSFAQVMVEDPAQEDIAKASQIAYNGEYTIEDDGAEEVTEPTQLDRVEAQVTYTAMMTDTLLEV